MRNTPPYVPGQAAPGEDQRDSPEIGVESHPITERADVTPQPVTPVERMGNQDIREIVAAAGAKDDYLLSFPCALAIAHNFTNQYWRVDAAQTWVPPGAVNFPLFMRGNKRALVRLDTPPGITAQAIVANQLIVILYMEKPQDAKPILDESIIASFPVSVTIAGNVAPAKVVTAEPALADPGLVVYLANPPGTNANAMAVTSAVVKAAAGKVFGGVLVNNNAALRYIQFFDLVAVPANGTVPLFSIPIPAFDSRTFDYGLRGRSFAVGLCWAGSTTFATLTLGAADAGADIQFV